MNRGDAFLSWDKKFSEIPPVLVVRLVPGDNRKRGWKMKEIITCNNDFGDKSKDSPSGGYQML